METTAISATPNQAASTAHPRVSAITHGSLPCRDLEESKQGGNYAIDFAALNYQWNG